MPHVFVTRTDEGGRYVVADLPEAFAVVVLLAQGCVPAAVEPRPPCATSRSPGMLLG